MRGRITEKILFYFLAIFFVVITAHYFLKKVKPSDTTLTDIRGNISDFYTKDLSNDANLPDTVTCTLKLGTHFSQKLTYLEGEKIHIEKERTDGRISTVDFIPTQTLEMEATKKDGFQITLSDLKSNTPILKGNAGEISLKKILPSIRLTPRYLIEETEAGNIVVRTYFPYHRMLAMSKAYSTFGDYYVGTMMGYCK